MPRPYAPIVGELAVSLHTHDGVQLYQFPAGKQTGLRWTRTLRDTSTCDLQVPFSLVHSRFPDIHYWRHWMSVWQPDDTAPLWSGPIRTITANDQNLSIGARDISAFTTRTRTPITKRWDAVDPATVAGELWQRMIEHHGLRADPVVRTDPDGKRYDHQVTADAAMVEANIAELVNLGLRWTVVRGVPILGPAPKKPVASLGRQHFTSEGPSITRDGSQSYNDVLVRGADTKERATAPMGGLHLQNLVDIDSMTGVSNVQKAALELARYASAGREILTLPGGTALHPDAPVTLDMLIPSTRFVIEAYGLLTMQELTGVEVVASPGQTEVKVTMASVNDNPPELLEEAGGAV